LLDVEFVVVNEKLTVRDGKEVIRREFQVVETFKKHIFPHFILPHDSTNFKPHFSLYLM
jgi:hypothetical protein